MNSATQASFLQPAQRGSARPPNAGAQAHGGWLARVGARLGNGGSTPGGRGRKPGRWTRRYPVFGVLPWAVFGAAAAVGAILAGASTIVAGCVVVLACAATALGWRLGERGRIALEQEIENRSWS